MNKVDWTKLIHRNQICLAGSYFSENNIKISKIKCLLSKSFRFSLLIQLRTKHNRFISYIAGFLLFYLYKSDIAKSAFVCEDVYFPHPMSIIIGGKASLNGELVVFDHTSFGKKYPGTLDGMPSLTGKGLIGSGAKLLGKISLNKKYVVGANSVLTKSISNKTFIGNSIIDGVYFESNP